MSKRNQEFVAEARFAITAQFEEHKTVFYAKKLRK
jgi:hypothetical protein